MADRLTANTSYGEPHGRDRDVDVYQTAPVLHRGGFLTERLAAARRNPVRGGKIVKPAKRRSLVSGSSQASLVASG